MHVEPAVDAVMLDEARDPLALVAVVPLMGNEDAGLGRYRDRGGNFVEEPAKRLHARGFELARIWGKIGQAPDQFLPGRRIFDRAVEAFDETLQQRRLNSAPVESDHASPPKRSSPRDREFRLDAGAHRGLLHFAGVSRMRAKEKSFIRDPPQSAPFLAYPTRRRACLSIRRSFRRLAPRGDAVTALFSASRRRRTRARRGLRATAPAARRCLRRPAASGARARLR